jgi:hypothetical protein
MQLCISSKLAKLDANRNELNCAEQYSTALRKVSHRRPNYPCRVRSAAAVRANIGNAVSREQSTPHIQTPHYAGRKARVESTNIKLESHQTRQATQQRTLDRAAADFHLRLVSS